MITLAVNGTEGGVFDGGDVGMLSAVLVGALTPAALRRDAGSRAVATSSGNWLSFEERAI